MAFVPTCARMAGGMPGFWKRSIDEFRRQANIAIRMEGLHRPQRPYPVVNFATADAIDRCKLMSDKDMGGFSHAELTYHGSSNGNPMGDASGREQRIDAELAPGEDPAHALFKGKISTELPANRPDIQRSGYAAFRTRDRGASLFGRLLFDLDPYSYLALRIKSDGRKYFVNIQTDSLVPTDLHQHLLPSFSPGQWETVAIPLGQFVRTNYGMVVEPQREMRRQKIKSVGIGLTDRVPGPFELAVAGVWATNREPKRGLSRDDSGFEVHEEEEEEARGLMDEVGPRRKKGEPERILI